MPMPAQGAPLVHPQAQAFLDALPASSPMPERDIPLPKFRALTNRSNKNQRLPEVASIKDITLPGHAGPIPARVYNPQPTAASKLPGLVYIHGGGWCLCSLDTHDPFCRDLAKQAGIIVVSVDYRLAPEHKFPAGLEDCSVAVQWVHQHAEELNIDATKLAIGGDSAGGNLASATLLVSQQRNVVPIAFQLLVYPMTTANMVTESRKEFGKGFALDSPMLDWFFASYVNDQQKDAENPLVAPYFATSLERMPPTHIVTAGCDPLRDEGKLYADKLKQNGVAVTYTNYDGMLHGFLFHNYVMQLDVGVQAVKDICMHLRHALHSTYGRL